MVCDDARPNIGYYRIMLILQELRRDGVITKEEFERAREYYQKKTNATMVFIYKEREEPKTT